MVDFIIDAFFKSMVKLTIGFGAMLLVVMVLAFIGYVSNQY